MHFWVQRLGAKIGSYGKCQTECSVGATGLNELPMRSYTNMLLTIEHLQVGPLAVGAGLVFPPLVEIAR